MKILPFGIRELPQSPSLRKLIGPSFILLSMGLGSGEVILWPYLVSNWGFGLIWGVLVGLTLQFFMNMEIERYSLARGESIFVGFARKSKILPYWFIFSTFIPWMWPGLAASSSTFISTSFGIQNTKILTIGILLLIGFILSLGPVLYKTVETTQKILITIGIPLIILIALFIIDKNDVNALINGLRGIGDGYRFIPPGMSLFSFLAALTYTGAGGNLNLAQSSYIREKGYGMGVYTDKISGLFSSKKEDITLCGNKFEINPENISKFKKWWKNINIEHFSLFWVIGISTIFILSLLSYATTYEANFKPEGINFAILESQIISEVVGSIVGTIFLVILGLMLFATQLSVMDATGRINSENIALASRGKISEKKIPYVYYSVLWMQIIIGILIYLFISQEPLQLVIISAVLNAFTMFIHVGLTYWVNYSTLEKPLRPGIFRTLMMIFTFLFYGGFSIYVLINNIIKI